MERVHPTPCVRAFGRPQVDLVVVMSRWRYGQAEVAMGEGAFLATPAESCFVRSLIRRGDGRRAADQTRGLGYTPVNSEES